MCREMIAAVANNGVVIVTWCNFHFFDFAKNWLMHIRDLNINSYVIGAMDDEVLQVSATPVPSDASVVTS